MITKTIKTALKKWLHNAERLAVLGVGSELRGDDAAGILVANNIIEYCKGPYNKRELEVFIGETAPENLTGRIKKFKPDHLLIIDSASAKKQPGEVVILEPQETQGIYFGTHKMPLKMLSSYIKDAVGCEILILGVQPKTLDFGALLSEEVQKSVRDISRLIEEIL